MVSPLSNAYIRMVNDFKSECEKLIENFKVKLSEDFRDFVPLWKSSKFNVIYERYSKDGNVNFGFKEDSLQIAKTIMLNDYFVGGLFLLYGLYFVQEDPKASIRLELYEFEKILKFIKEERKTLIETCQPGYLFAKLFKNDAFAFVRFARDFSMEGQNRSRMLFSGQPVLMEEDRSFCEKEWLEGFLNNVDFLDDIKKVEEEYHKRKMKLKEDYPELNLALDMVPDDIVNGMLKNLKQPTLKQNDSVESETVGSRRRTLKRRKLKIKRRFTRNDSEDHNQETAFTVKRCRKGPPKGGRTKHYFKTLVNNPESENDETEVSELDDPLLSLPDI